MEISSTLLFPLISFLTSFFLFLLFIPSLQHKTHNPNSLASPEKPPICHDHDDTPSTPSAEEGPAKEEQEEEEDKKRRKRGRKKRHQQPNLVESREEPATKAKARSGDGAAVPQILKTANQSNIMTVPQVSEFIGCLVEARDELQHRSEQIQRSYKIKKALLSTANKSSFDHLWDEAQKLEKEHKRLGQMLLFRR